MTHTLMLFTRDILIALFAMFALVCVIYQPKMNGEGTWLDGKYVVQSERVLNYDHAVLNALRGFVYALIAILLKML